MTPSLICRRTAMVLACLFILALIAPKGSRGDQIEPLQEDTTEQQEGKSLQQMVQGDASSAEQSDALLSPDHDEPILEESGHNESPQTGADKQTLEHPAAEQRDIPPEKAEKTPGPVERWLKGRFEAGMWWREIDLRKERIHNYDPALRNGFLPRTTIDHLEVQQDTALIPFLRINLCKYFSIWLSRGEEVRAIAWTHGDESWDGVIALEATRAVYGEVRFPLKYGVAPYAFYGQIDYDANFEHNPAWYAGGRRKMFLDDTKGDRYGFGVQWKLARYAGVEAFWSRTDVDVYCRYYLLGELRSEGNFPLSHESMGLAAFVYY